MESSVKSIPRPVIERLPVNQLDEFACRQLDRVRFVLVDSVPITDAYVIQLGRYGRPGSDDPPSENQETPNNERDRRYWEEELYRRLREKTVTSADSSREASVAPSEGKHLYDV